MSVIATYLNDNAQTPLARFVANFVEGETNSGLSSILSTPAITACRDEIVSKSTVGIHE